LERSLFRMHLAVLNKCAGGTPRPYPPLGDWHKRCTVKAAAPPFRSGAKALSVELLTHERRLTGIEEAWEGTDNKKELKLAPAATILVGARDMRVWLLPWVRSIIITALGCPEAARLAVRTCTAGCRLP
jgi:hypothetical protein